jgi:hypothetical protein
VARNRTARTEKCTPWHNMAQCILRPCMFPGLLHHGHFSPFTQTTRPTRPTRPSRPSCCIGILFQKVHLGEAIREEWQWKTRKSRQAKQNHGLKGQQDLGFSPTPWNLKIQWHSH